MLRTGIITTHLRLRLLVISGFCQQQSEGKTLGKGQALIVPQDSPGMDR